MNLLLFSSRFAYRSNLDLSDRFRSITTAHAQVTGLSTFLELAHWQYQSLLISFAKDLQVAEARFPRSDDYWVLSGLCTEQQQAIDLFKVVDDFVTAFSATAPEDLSELVFSLHGRFLNVLSHLHGEDPRMWPDIPAAPTFESKHAPHAPVPSEAEGSAPEEGTAPVAPSVTAPSPAPSSSKGKGKEPLFLPPSPSVVSDAKFVPESGELGDVFFLITRVLNAFSFL